MLNRRFVALPWKLTKQKISSARLQSGHKQNNRVGRFSPHKKKVRYSLPPQSHLNKEPRVKNHYVKEQPTNRDNRKSKKRGPHRDPSPASDAVVPDSSLTTKLRSNEGGTTIRTSHERRRRKSGSVRKTLNGLN